MRGTTNTTALLATGNPLPAEEVDDVVKIATSADDDALYELVHLDPPAAASITNVSVGFLPLLDGLPLVIGNASSRKVTVMPARYIRSATDNTNVRKIVSATLDVPTDVALPAVPAAGKWGFLLLYAQLSYADPTDPTKGMAVTLQFATAPIYQVYAAAAEFGSLPANTSSPPTWNIPLKYVRTLNSDTTQLQESIVDYPPGPITTYSGGVFTGSLRQRISKKCSGIGVRRLYCSANQNPVEMVLGGASAYVTVSGSKQKLTSTIMPALVGRHEVEAEIFELILPGEITGPTGGVTVDTVVDDTRDWRGANMTTIWTLNPDGSAHDNLMGEDDTSNGTAEQRHMPTQASTFAAGACVKYIAHGQSWSACTPSAVLGTALWMGQIGVEALNEPIDFAETLWMGGSGCGLFVDGTTGVLKYRNKLAGGAARGTTVYIVGVAFFSNHVAV